MIRTEDEDFLYGLSFFFRALFRMVLMRFFETWFGSSCASFGPKTSSSRHTHMCTALVIWVQVDVPILRTSSWRKKKLNSVKHFDRNMSLECCELCLICRKNLEISSFCCKTLASYWSYLVPICFSLKVSIQCSYQDFSQYRNFRIYFQK